MSETVGTKYAIDVVDGRIVAGPWVRNACRRHLDDLENGPKRGLHFDVEAAEWFDGFCRDVLKLTGGSFDGKPLVLHPSQRFITDSIFGWKKERKGKLLRRFRRSYVEQAKGQGKSPVAAAIGLYGLVADGEGAAEIYSIASTKDQAMVLFRDAVGMRDMSPILEDNVNRMGNPPYAYNLSHDESRSFFRPLSRDTNASGIRPHFALADEIHEMANADPLELIERGFKFREQPLLLMITNSGSDRNSVCWQEHLHAIRCATGNRDLHGRDAETTDYLGDPSTWDDYDNEFSYVCALDPGDDFLNDPTCWIKANPMLDVTVTKDYLADVVRQAKSIPAKQNMILRLHGCVWTDSDVAWMSRETFEPCLADFDPTEVCGGKPACLGVDLSATRDLTAVAYICETGSKTLHRDGGSVTLPCYHLWVESFTPRDTLRERAEKDQAPYELWESEGWLRTCEGKQIRLDEVAASISRASADFELMWLAYDAYSFSKLQEALDEFGVDVKTASHAQGGKRRSPLPEDFKDAQEESDAPLGLWMPASLALLETLILEGRITFRRDPVFISAVMGATTESDALGNRWLAKQKATKRIDPLVSAAMAVGMIDLLRRCQTAIGSSVYNDSKLHVIDTDRTQKTSGKSVYEQLSAMQLQSARRAWGYDDDEY